jgi:hypothetical protein
MLSPSRRAHLVSASIVMIFLVLSLSAQSQSGEEASSRSAHRLKVSKALAPATLGVEYSEVISVSGGTPPYQFVTDDLPSGMTLNPTTGQLSGTPQTEGSLSFSVKVFDAKGTYKTQKLTLPVGKHAEITITVTPASATVNSAATAQFQATVMHNRNSTVLWTASSGNVSSSGLYTAPAVTSNTTAVLTATSAADSTKFASASVSIIAPVVGISLSPATASVNSAATAQFQAAVTNSTNTLVNWTASAGTVSSTGLYTAPAVTSNTTAVLTATSAADSTKSAIANISVVAPVAVAITLTPTTASVTSGATAQFQAAVTNSTNTTVNWTTSAGTVSSTGLYTAPAVTSNTSAVLTATSAADTTKSAVANISVVAPVAITLTPTTSSVTSAATAQFQAAVTNSTNTTVNWTASAGTVSSTGLYTAPAVTSNTTAVLTATSAADTTKSAVANISVLAPVAINLTPTTSSLTSGGTAQFQAAVTNSTNTTVNWTTSAGTVSSTGLYTAPAVTSNTTVVLTATSAADTTKSAVANISVVPPVGITVTPTSSTVNSASTAQFQAYLTNTSNTAVTWTASAGTVSNSGLYTAPAITSNTTAVVMVTSSADSTKSATANISLIAPLIAISLTPGTTNVNSGSTAQFQAAVTNTSNTGVTWTASTGSVSSAGLYTAPAIKSNTTAVVTATSVADSTKSATATVSLIAATPKVMLEVLYPPTNPHTSDFQAVQAYLMTNPAVTGGNLAVEWGMIDQGPSANPQYVWTAVDALIAPWAAAGKLVNLIVWANSDNTTTPCSNGVTNTTGNCGIPSYVWTALGPSNYVTCNTQYGVQQIPNYLVQSAFQQPYQQFMVAMLAKYGSNPNIGYIRFGLGHGGETLPASSWNDTTSACGQAFAAWGYTITTWESYLSGMLNYESNLHSPKQLMVGVTPMGSPTTAVPDFVAPLAVPGLGIGSQGFEQSDITGYPNCTADWCNLFARYAGLAPLELQTYLQSCPDNTCTTGSLVNLIPFGIAHHASVFEIYYQDWLVAFAPGYPGNSQYGGSYAQVLTNAANSNIQ